MKYIELNPIDFRRPVCELGPENDASLLLGVWSALRRYNSDTYRICPHEQDREVGEYSLELGEMAGKVLKGIDLSAEERAYLETMKKNVYDAYVEVLFD